MASWLSSLLLFTLLLISLPSSSSSSSPIDTVIGKQASILVTLKQSLHTTGSFLDSWSLSNHSLLCSWSGIRCDDTKRVVVAFDISNANISGTVSPILAQLTSLTYLSVAGNGLSGRFPREVCYLANLRHLNISNNQFNDTFQGWDFSSLSVGLELFDAYNNDFHGSLPLGLTLLPNLLHLDLGGNYFSGGIPKGYGGFPKLSYLSLAGNDLGGCIPPELGNLSTLRQLYLGYYNQFTGGIPPELGKLSGLIHLDFSSCGLTGTIPPELGNMTSLDTLFLQTNQLTGVIPQELGNLTCLIALDLSNNDLTGGIPSEFSNLHGLYLLHLFINRFHREIPPFIAQLPNLELLKLWQNNFTGTIPPGLGKNGKLRELDLSTNKLTGVIPENLCHGRKLEILILLNNFLFGALPSDLGLCTTLSRVRMGQNYLSGNVPRGFLFLPELLLVELQNNYLTGRIADESRKSTPSKLSQINLSNNRLFGPIPTSIGGFLALQILMLNGNQFTGVIPPELGKLKHVLKIDLSRNNFSGEVPPDLGGCSLLTYLDLSRNQLSGAIPPQISDLHVLNYLNLSWNRLNQNIPKEIGGMKSLTSVDFSHNDLSGRVPENGQFSFFNSSSFLANPQLCGTSTGSAGLTSCDYTSNAMSSSQSGQQQNAKSNLPGKFKLVLALVLLACSLAFATATVVVKAGMIVRNSKSSWKMTAFQKLEFGRQDVVGCLKETNIIGRGGAGVVYRGTMPDGQQVAVKKLLGMGRRRAARSSSPPHDNGFSAEIRTLGKIRHRNIVRLLAFCSNVEMNLLVYEYMPNGSLGELLHGKRGGYLDWDVRVKVAVEAAKGLCYLHHDCCPPILHRDVKSNNILLDAGLEAHVADFGLAKFLRDTGMSECMSAIAGSYGYIAPEYAYTLKVDEKSDVYSFGVVLLELVTGRRPVGDFGEEGMDIVQWAKINTNWSKERVVRILDRRLAGAVPSEEAMQVFFVAMLCVQERSVERPTMREVVQMLVQAKQPCAA